MLRMKQKHSITIATTIAVRHPLDNSLSLIERYLADRLVEREDSAVPGNDIMIDLGVFNIAEDLEEKRRWPHWAGGDFIYPVRLDGSRVILGPLYNPEAGGPCPTCLARRCALTSLCQQQTLGAAREMLVFAENPWLTPFALEVIWTVIEAVCWQSSAQANVGERGQIYTLHLDSLRLTRYQLIPDANCPICAHPRQDSPELAQIQLSSRPKKALSAYRLVEADAYELPLPGGLY